MNGLLMQQYDIISAAAAIQHDTAPMVESELHIKFDCILQLLSNLPGA